ncbi:hypothetical protein M378DRAFT_165576 [Amanita muscaria Koide BX008]|uniref:Uncharacterized protein n=1 Tax=Amanita muscaria (strain Koide BX008) TaxID=946122 RepID=A0A0C2T7J1_AMAMK|nr:hypothetical protein M378DRAFT_165576 [Amanita muscaria Koide BX008]
MQRDELAVRKGGGVNPGSACYRAASSVGLGCSELIIASILPHMSVYNCVPENTLLQ